MCFCLTTLHAGRQDLCNKVFNAISHQPHRLPSLLPPKHKARYKLTKRCFNYLHTHRLASRVGLTVRTVKTKLNSNTLILSFYHFFQVKRMAENDPQNPLITARVLSSSLSLTIYSLFSLDLLHAFMLL